MGFAPAPQVISDTEAEEQTCGAVVSVSGVEEDNVEAAKKAKVRPALTISDLATRFSQHVASGRHGMKWMFGENECPAIMEFYEALFNNIFQRDVVVPAAVRELLSDMPWKVTPAS